MKRHVIAPRPDWVQRVEEVGFNYHTGGLPPSDLVDGTYWYEGAYYEFTLAQVEQIEAASESLHGLCLKAMDHIVRESSIMDVFGIPRDWQDYVRRSWERRDPYVMGRFDLAFDPKTGAVKMLEYNADTPTLVIETAVVQWMWLEDRFPKLDQFNSLHDKLIDRYREIVKLLPRGVPLHFSSMSDYVEEYQHTLYFQDLVQQAGVPTAYCPIQELGWNEEAREFRDLGDQPIQFLSMLYPWEWMMAEEFGRHVLHDRVGFLEPVWKMILSNKAILPILWRLFPGHPNLLPASFEANDPDVGPRFIEKPILSREGANMRLVRPGQPDVVTGGSYGGKRNIYQQVVDLPVIDGQHVVIGSWMVGDQPAGMILRESESPIVVNTSRVVPHLFVE